MTKQDSRCTFQTVTSFEVENYFTLTVLFFNHSTLIKNTGCRPKETVIQPGTNGPKHLKTDAASPNNGVANLKPHFRAIVTIFAISVSKLNL